MLLVCFFLHLPLSFSHWQAPELPTTEITESQSGTICEYKHRHTHNTSFPTDTERLHLVYVTPDVPATQHTTPRCGLYIERIICSDTSLFSCGRAVISPHTLHGVEMVSVNCTDLTCQEVGFIVTRSRRRFILLMLSICFHM